MFVSFESLLEAPDGWSAQVLGEPRRREAQREVVAFEGPLVEAPRVGFGSEDRVQLEREAAPVRSTSPVRSQAWSNTSVDGHIQKLNRVSGGTGLTHSMM